MCYGKLPNSRPRIPRAAKAPRATHRLFREPCRWGSEWPQLRGFRFPVRMDCSLSFHRADGFRSQVRLQRFLSRTLPESVFCVSITGITKEQARLITIGIRKGRSRNLESRTMPRLEARGRRCLKPRDTSNTRAAPCSWWVWRSMSTRLLLPKSAGGTVAEPGLGTVIGGLGGCIVGGIAGYAGASWAAGKTYDWVEETFFEPLPEMPTPGH